MANIRFETRLPPQTVIGRLKWRTAIRYTGDWCADERACGPDPLVEGVVADDGFVLRTRAGAPPFRYAAVCRGEVRATASGSIVDARIRLTIGTWLPLFVSSAFAALGALATLGAAFGGAPRNTVIGVVGVGATGVLVLLWLVGQFRRESATICYVLEAAAGLDES